MSWAEDAVRRVIALHTRTVDGKCEVCIDDFGDLAGYEEWPCPTLVTLWKLGPVEGPQQEPLQGPSMTWHQAREYRSRKMTQNITKYLQANFAAPTSVDVADATLAQIYGSATTKTGLRFYIPHEGYRD
jgi:hypothetical protein